MGNFKEDPGIYATNLVTAIWENKPDLFNGKLGQRPHKITIAACAFAKEVDEKGKNHQNFKALTLSLGRILLEVQRNGGLYPFNSIDQKLLQVAWGVFEENESNLAALDS